MGLNPAQECLLIVSSLWAHFQPELFLGFFTLDKSLGWCGVEQSSVSHLKMFNPTPTSSQPRDWFYPLVELHSASEQGWDFSTQVQIAQGLNKLSLRETSVKWLGVERRNEYWNSTWAAMTWVQPVLRGSGVKRPWQGLSRHPVSPHKHITLW